MVYKYLGVLKMHKKMFQPKNENQVTHDASLGFFIASGSAVRLPKGAFMQQHPGAFYCGLTKEEYLEYKLMCELNYT